MFASSGIIDNITDSPFFSVDVAITGCNIRGMLSCFPFHQTSVPASFSAMSFSVLPFLYLQFSVSFSDFISVQVVGMYAQFLGEGNGFLVV
jgi:hypothetical protein